jgi:hypothetical protein
VEGGLACQIRRENTNVVFRGDVEELLDALLGIGVCSRRSKDTYRKESTQINTRLSNATI